MNAEELNSLVEKYYNGDTSREEEIFLRDFFTGDSVPDGYEAESEIFSFYKLNDEIPVPSEDFESKILARINDAERKKDKFNIRVYLIPILGAAASILIMAGSWIFFAKKVELRDTFSDPKIAYAETRKILLDVSAKMNHATLALEPVGKMNKMKAKSFDAINKSTVIIEKNLKSLGKLPSTGSLRQAPFDRLPSTSSGSGER
jgi:hypothetical protein